MRLTVHLKHVKKKRVEVDTKDGVELKDKIFNTLSYHDIKEGEVPGILSQINESKQGEVASYYLT